MHTSLLVLLLTILPALPASQQTQQQEPAKRTDAVMQRGEHVMGFSHGRTIHHFRLFKDGGEIVVDANDPNDKSSID